jgi:hypothetical protein
MLGDILTPARAHINMKAASFSFRSTGPTRTIRFNPCRRTAFLMRQGRIYAGPKFSPALVTPRAHDSLARVR